MRSAAAHFASAHIASAHIASAHNAYAHIGSAHIVSAHTASAARASASPPHHRGPRLPWLRMRWGALNASHTRAPQAQQTSDRLGQSNCCPPHNNATCKGIRLSRISTFSELACSAARDDLGETLSTCTSLLVTTLVRRCRHARNMQINIEPCNSLRAGKADAALRTLTDIQSSRGWRNGNGASATCQASDAMVTDVNADRTTTRQRRALRKSRVVSPAHAGARLTHYAECVQGHCEPR